MKLTRRELALLAAGAPAMAVVPRAQAAQETAEQLYNSALQDMGKSVDKVRKFRVPIETEPAFQFKA